MDEHLKSAKRINGDNLADALIYKKNITFGHGALLINWIHSGRGREWAKRAPRIGWWMSGTN